MKKAEVEINLERGREKFPGVAPRIISGNGPQFIAKDFKQFIRLCGMTHVRTSPFYHQSNGKIERWHQFTERGMREAGRAIGYLTPLEKLEGREQQIFAERDRKLEQARQQRQIRRRAA